MMVAIPELDGAAGRRLWRPVGRHGRCAMAASQERRCWRTGSRADRPAPSPRERRIAGDAVQFPAQQRARAPPRTWPFTLAVQRADGAQVQDTVDLPADAEALRTLVLKAMRKVWRRRQRGRRIPVDDHVAGNGGWPRSRRSGARRPSSRRTAGRCSCWGALGNVLVAVSRVRLRRRPDATVVRERLRPTHAFPPSTVTSARTSADAVLHFGTHGALEFMPGKQTGLSGDCWLTG